MRTPSDNRKGQALLMVTLALLAMFGIMGLAVDVGWSYYVRKMAQAAADSAALAAAQAALASAEDAGQLDSTTVEVGSVKCPGGEGNLVSGCDYARANGFPKTPETAAQTVTMEADLGAVRPPPTAPGIATDYWVTARVQEDIPQLFSAVMGNLTGRSGARATAAIVEVDFPGSLILLNRQRDCIAMNGPSSVVCGVNLFKEGNDSVTAKSGILMASTRHGDDLLIPKDGAQWAGYVKGSATVRSDFTGIRGAGEANVPNSPADPKSDQWDKPWQNLLPDSSYFRDPMRNIKQQPPPPSGLQLKEVNAINCGFYGDPSKPPFQVTPGAYFLKHTDTNKCNTFDRIQIGGNVEFTGGSNFSDYVFFGGMEIRPDATVKFGPGRYVFAGVKPPNGNQRSGVLFDASAGQLTMQDGTPLAADGSSQPNTDAGELFIFTDTTYPGLQEYTGQFSGDMLNDLELLQFGRSEFQTGSGKTNIINLHGLNVDATGVPAELKEFASVVFWQDQRNSVTKYWDGTNKLMGCIGGDQGYGSGCANTPSRPNSPQLTIQATPSVKLYGVIYQPRGAWTELVGDGSYSGPLRIITGAISLHGGVDLSLQTLQTPMKVRTVTLIE